MKFFGHNFGVVYRFEFFRMLKRKSFWIMIVIFPLLTGLIVAIESFSSQQTASTSNSLKNQNFSIAYTDESGTISPFLATKFGAKTVASKNDGIREVKQNKIDAYFYYPKNLAKASTEVYAQNVGIFENNKYNSVAQELAHESAMLTINNSAAMSAEISNSVNVKVTTYRGGVVYDPLMEAIVPGIFLILFYLIIIAFGGQMMSATIEEKENRVTEIILTTIKSRTLIAGKIFAFISLILVQAAMILAIVVIGYFLFRNSLQLPNIDFAHIPLDWPRIIIGAVLFFVSILLFSGLLVALGAMMPTAREASQYLSIPMLLIFMPLYMVTMLISNTGNMAVTILTFFPFTAPIPLMLRNAAGSLDITSTIIGTAIMLVTTVIVFWLAAKMFQIGAVEYSQKLSLRRVFAKKSKA